MRTNAAGIQLNYELEGSGTPLVLTHGLGDDLHFWDGVAPELARHHALVRWEGSCALWKGDGVANWPPRLERGATCPSDHRTGQRTSSGALGIDGSGVIAIPARILPTAALVLALTPLVDPRFVVALEDLRGRRFDVAVVLVDPVPLVQPGRTEVERAAYRL